MKTVYVNQRYLKDKEAVRGFAVLDKTIDEDLKILFNPQLLDSINNLKNTEPTKRDGFHFFTTFCQFVVYFQYSTKKVLLNNKPHILRSTIEFLYFGTSDNINDAFDYMLKLRNAGWEYESREEILKLAYQIKDAIKNPDFEIAELIVKDRPGLLSSYL